MNTSIGPIHRIAKYAGGRIELWFTPCIVTMPPPGSNCLLVPSNERLCGTQFSHFPVGGPTPSAPYIGVRPPPPSLSNRAHEDSATKTKLSQNILYPCEAVDGVISELGGPEQEYEIQQTVPIPAPVSPILVDHHEYPIRCPTGEARRVNAVGLLRHFDSLILAVAPFWESSGQWERELTSAYRNGMKLAHGILAAPLLGAGTRGIPINDAARIAADATLTYMQKNSDEIQSKKPQPQPQQQQSQLKQPPPLQQQQQHETLKMIRFAVLDEDVAEVLDEHLQKVHELHK